MRVKIFLAGLLLQYLSAQSYDPRKPLAPDELLLARIRYVVSQMLNQMPNFTCVETIERSNREAKSKKYSLVDNLRIEVAYVDGKELYAWPGAKKFEEREISQMVGTAGAIGTGDFVLHARSIFLGKGPNFDYKGVEEVNGRRAHKFHFQMPQRESGYIVRIPPAQEPVGYQGFVWNDEQSLELLRIELNIDEIPQNLPLRSGYKLIDYTKVRIGETPYVLPSAMDMTLTDVNGAVSRNRTTFTGCRQYAGESTLIFEDPAPDAKPTEAPIEWTLPEGLNVNLKLLTTLDLGKAATGDQVTFEVSKDVEKGGQQWMAKGAKVEMRLNIVVCRDFPLAHCYFALVPERFSFQNKSGDFPATLVMPPLDRTIQLMFANSRPEFRLPPAQLGMAAKGSSILLLRGTKPKLSSGFTTTWHTLKERGE